MSHYIKNSKYNSWQHLSFNTTNLLHLVSEGTQVAIAELEKVEISNAEVWEKNIEGICFEIDKNAN